MQYWGMTLKTAKLRKLYGSRWVHFVPREFTAGFPFFTFYTFFFTLFAIPFVPQSLVLTPIPIFWTLFESVTVNFRFCHGLVTCLEVETEKRSIMVGRNFLVAAVFVPLVCFLLFKFQDGDFILMIYEKIGQDPAVALRGKVVWITGASSGIGEYLAYELVKYGCKLVLSARRKAELERVKKNCAGRLK